MGGKRQLSLCKFSDVSEKGSEKQVHDGALSQKGQVREDDRISRVDVPLKSSEVICVAQTLYSYTRMCVHSLAYPSSPIDYFSFSCGQLFHNEKVIHIQMCSHS